MPFSLAVFPFQQPRGHHYTLLAKVHADKELYSSDAAESLAGALVCLLLDPFSLSLRR